MDLSSIIEEIGNSSTTEEAITGHAKAISKNIAAGQARLVDVVGALGPKLTSTEVQDRVRAMDFLSQVLGFLKSDFLSEKKLSFIVEFLHDRLKDQHVVIPKVFLCILPVIRSKNLPEGSATLLLNQLFREGNIQSHTHKHRRAVFQTFQYALNHHLEELKKLSSTDFVMNFLQSMDGEKDPRNLLVLFHSIPIILAHFPLGPFVEDFFEVLSCYFPIDFKPSAPVPGGEVITREDLAHPLHKCLSQTNEFCKLLIPLLMEKLDSSIVDAKLDSLELLGMCCGRSYTPEDLNPYLTTIWHSLRREIFMGGNEIVETACINFLRIAFRNLARNNNIMNTCVTMIYSECKHHLADPELRLSHPSARVLTAIAEGSPHSCQAVLNMTLPFLHTQFSSNPATSVRKGLLSIMTTLTSTLRIYPSVKLVKVLPNWDEILAMWFTLLTHSDQEFTLISLEFFSKLLNNSRIKSKDPVASESLSPDSGKGIAKSSENDEEVDLSQKHRTLLQEHLLCLLVRFEIREEVRSTVITTMAELAKSYEEEFTVTSIPKLLSHVTSEDLVETVKRSVLNALVESSVNPLVVKDVIPFLLRLEKNSIFDYEILLCLASIVEKNCQKGSDDEAGANFTNFMFQEMKCLDVFWKMASNVDLREKPDPTFLILVRILRTLIRSAEESSQQDIITSYWNKRMAGGDVACWKVVNEIPAPLLESLLGSVRPSVQILERNKLLDVLLAKATTTPVNAVEMSTETKTQSDEIATVRLCAALLNKAEEPEFQILLEKVESVFESLFVESDQSQSDVPSSESDKSNSASQNDKIASKRLIVLFATVVKALAMRGIPDLKIWLDRMVALLDNPTYGILVSKEFSSLMTECTISLNSASYCNVRFLYKQRLFMELVPKLVEGFGKCSKTSGGTRANYMRALSSQLKYVPGPVLQMQIDNVFPLLVASLTIDSEMSEVSNSEILTSTLVALRDFFETQKETLRSDSERSVLVKYLHDLVPRLLILSRFKHSMEIRILSLKCLLRCAKLPTHVVLPLKPSVTKTLKNALDDPKRLVRRDATLTRNVWVLVGAPGGI